MTLREEFEAVTKDIEEGKYTEKYADHPDIFFESTLANDLKELTKGLIRDEEQFDMAWDLSKSVACELLLGPYIEDEKIALRATKFFADIVDIISATEGGDDE